MTRAFIRDLSALLLVCLGLGATIAAGGLDPRTLAFATATIFAWGTSGSWGPGLLALLAGIGAHPMDLQPIFPTAPVITAVTIGVGLGLLVRYLASDGWHGPLNRETTLSLILLAAGALFLFQPSMARLATTDGTPALFGLEVIDTTTLLPTVVHRHVAIAMPHPLEGFRLVIAVMLLATSWMGFARVGDPGKRTSLVTLVGVVTALALVGAMVMPLFDTVALDTNVIRQQLSLRSGGHGAINAMTVPEVTFAPWSRPPLDALRLILILGAISLNLSRKDPKRGPTARPSVNIVVFAMAALVLAFGLQGMMPEAVAGVAIILLTAVVAGRAGRSPGAPAIGHGVVRAPQVAFLVGLFLLLTTLSLAPIAP